MPSASPQKTPREKTRVSRLFAPPELKDSPLLPGDRWLFKNAFDILKNNRPLQKNILRIGIFSALAAMAVSAGIAGMFAGIPVLSAVIGVAALAGAAICGRKIRDGWKDFKTDILPKLRTEITVRYINMKGPQLVNMLKEKNRQGTPAAKKPAPKTSFLRALFSKRAAKPSPAAPGNAPPHHHTPPKP
jgi:hypothetical protein